jgi:YgiT-type zinc finger domain-containing protein
MTRKCPKCGTQIDYLVKRHIEVWKTYYNGQNFLTEEYLSWSCPECGAVLFEGSPESEIEAIKWLAGE